MHDFRQINDYKPFAPSKLTPSFSTDAITSTTASTVSNLKTIRLTHQDVIGAEKVHRTNQKSEGGLFFAINQKQPSTSSPPIPAGKKIKV